MNPFVVLSAMIVTIFVIFSQLLLCDAVWATMMIETKLTSASADVKTLSVLRHEDEGCLLSSIAVSSHISHSSSAIANVAFQIASF